MNLWLDDVRSPTEHGCAGWSWAKNYEEAIRALSTGKVEMASLDHDLGQSSCQACRTGATSATEYTRILELGCPHGEKTGYDVVCWMEENDCWPKKGTIVHSANPAGAARMRQVIKLHYYTEAIRGNV